MNEQVRDPDPQGPIATGITPELLELMQIGEKRVFGDVSVLRMPTGWVVTALTFARIAANPESPPIAMAQSSVFVPL